MYQSGWLSAHPADIVLLLYLRFTEHTFTMEDVYDGSTDESDTASVDSEVGEDEITDFPTSGLSISREEADRWMLC